MSSPDPKDLSADLEQEEIPTSIVERGNLAAEEDEEIPTAIMQRGEFSEEEMPTEIYGADEDPSLSRRK